MPECLFSYGFVRFASPDEAAAAVAALDGLPVQGHRLQVKLADHDAGACRAPAVGDAPLSQRRGYRAPHTRSVCGREAGAEAAAMV